MTWFSRNARTLGFLGFGILAGGSALAVTDKLVSKDERPEVPVTKKPQEPYLSSVLKVNKVLASYTTNFEPSVRWDYNWDRRDPKSLVKPPKDGEETDDYKLKLKEKTPTASRHIFLIRHGQYNLKGDTDEKQYLTELGRQQAELTGKRLKELNHPFTVLVNSTMTRATETANIIAEQLPSVPRKSCDLLREGAPYPPEPPLGSWRPEASEFHADGARIEAAFRRYMHRAEPDQREDSYEIYACHGNVIRFFMCRALQLPPEAWLRMGLYHGSITHLVIRPSGRVAMRTFGDAGHMPVPKLSTT